MIKRAITTLLICWAILLPHSTIATPLVADLSNYRIYVDSGFNGTRLFLFGARNDNGDIVVVVRGPLQNYIVRKKEQIGGIWVNRKRMKFFNVPDFYMAASSKPLDDITQYGVFEELGIGKKHLLFPPRGKHDPKEFKSFSQAFIRHQEDEALYSVKDLPINFMAETLFKTVITFPDNIPPGKYTAEIFLVSDGSVVGMQSTPIVVEKTGLDAFIYNYAHNHPAAYGLTAVVIALCAGWFGGRLFGKT